MACDISAGRIEPCKTSNGGLKAVYIINYDSNISTNIIYDLIDTDSIEELTDNPTAYKYDLKGTSTFEQTITSSRENGTTVFGQTLTLNLKKLSAKDNNQIKLLAYGRPQVIVEDNNGNFFMCGLVHGMEVSGTISTGAALADMSGYSLTFAGEEPVPANFFVSTLTAAGITVVVGV
jgi:hypothetical protein